jgi:hypothetical protein
MNAARRRTEARVRDATGDRSWLGWIAVGVVLGAASASLAIGCLTRGAVAARDTAATIETAVRAREEQLPVPSASDVDRARMEYDRGHLREALLALEGIRVAARQRQRLAEGGRPEKL